MTSSSYCHKCGVICYSFHYNQPLTVTGHHDGYWHCAEHGPQPTFIVVDDPAYTELKTTNVVVPKKLDHTKLNRAQRRALARGKR